MRARTEDLLTLRDGEPIDAAAREALLADPTTDAEIERLEAVRRALRELPDIEPPDGLWERVAALAAAEEPRPARQLRRLVGGAAVALPVAVAAVWLVARPPAAPEAGAPPATTVAESRPMPAPVVEIAPRGPLVQPSYASLVEQSARLERVLAQMRDHQRPVMTGGTASTIAGLEDRIIMIDEQLTHAAAEGVRPEERKALWRERVEVMNALVQVRMAQSERGGF